MNGKKRKVGLLMVCYNCRWWFIYDFLQYCHDHKTEEHPKVLCPRCQSEMVCKCFVPGTYEDGWANVGVLDYRDFGL